MRIHVKRFPQLKLEELYEILKLRTNVFVVEQNCPYPELDDRDQEALHVWVDDETGIQAYLRIMDRGVESEYVSIGRVISMKRQCGLGSLLLQKGIEIARRFYRAERIYLEAQTSVRKFYEKQGFRQISEEFLMDGISHIMMIWDGAGIEKKQDTQKEKKRQENQEKKELSGRFVIFDVETPNRKNDRISAIGITVIEGQRIVDRFFSYVNPETYFDPFHTRLTGISALTVKNAPTFEELWKKMEPIFSEGVLVAHNAVFDMGVLKKCLKQYHILWKPSVRYLCTVQVGRKLLPHQGHKLNELCAYYGIDLDHHKADSDSQACAEILLRYLKKEGEKIQEYVKNYELR